MTAPCAPGIRWCSGTWPSTPMVKTNTFNGMALPSIVWRDLEGREHLVKSFGYEDFKGRLS